MKIKKNISSKDVLCLFVFVGILSITSCGSWKAKAEGMTVSVAEDGAVHSYIAEGFDKDYYDKEELQQRILSAAASYNRETGGQNISVDKVSVEKQMAVVQMTYASSADYAAFNEGVFFVGTTKEAEEAGYDLNVVLSGTKNEQETIGKSDLLGMSDVKILITDMTEAVTLNGKALYCSENVSVSKNLKTISRQEESDKMAYIIYQ